MEDQRRIPLFVPVPTSLKVVAWLWIISGILSLVGFVLQLLSGEFHLDLGFLGIFVGSGLLRFSNGWRICALVLSWITIILLCFIGVICLMNPVGNISFNFMGQTTSGVPQILGFLLLYFLLVGVAVLTIWEIWVLSRADVRILFEPDNPFHTQLEQPTNILDEIKQMEYEVLKAQLGDSTPLLSGNEKEESAGDSLRSLS